MTTIRIPTIRQGQTGMGQGGFTCYRFVQSIGESVTIALRSAIPLETDLDVVHAPEHWHLVDPAHPEVVILEATRWEPDYATTTAISIAEASAARDRFALTEKDHPAPECMSCGIRDHSLRVHAGPLGDGRWATPFRVPHRNGSNREIDDSLVWMAMDCATGWYVSNSEHENRPALTVQFAVDVCGLVKPETDYALVAWNGDYEPAWDGRKRGAAAALFDRDGSCVAQSRSFWVAQA